MEVLHSFNGEVARIEKMEGGSKKNFTEGSES